LVIEEMEERESVHITCLPGIFTHIFMAF